jgi:hypothetical protein
MQLGDDGSANQPSAACYRNAHAHLPFLTLPRLWYTSILTAAIR